MHRAHQDYDSVKDDIGEAYANHQESEEIARLRGHVAAEEE